MSSLLIIGINLLIFVGLILFVIFYTNRDNAAFMSRIANIVYFIRRIPLLNRLIPGYALARTCQRVQKEFGTPPTYFVFMEGEVIQNKEGINQGVCGVCLYDMELGRYKSIPIWGKPLNALADEHLKACFYHLMKSIFSIYCHTGPVIFFLSKPLYQLIKNLNPGDGGLDEAIIKYLIEAEERGVASSVELTSSCWQRDIASKAVLESLDKVKRNFYLDGGNR